MSDTHEGEVLYGQQYDQNDDIVVGYTELMVNVDRGTQPSALGDARTEITPDAAQSVKVRVWEPPTEALDTFILELPATTDLRLPDVLESITVTYNTAEGAGIHIEDGDGVSIGTSAGLSLSLNSKSQGSASIVPDIQPNIVQRWAFDVPCKRYLMYVESGYTQEELITRLETHIGVTVNPWPKFAPRPHFFTLKGLSITASADANVQQHLSAGSSATYTWGEGEGVSYEVSTTTRTIVIPPTIHGAITLLNTSQDANIVADAETGWAASGSWPARSAAASVVGTITASVTPTSLSATTVAGIPTSGLYLHNIVAEPYKWGRVRLRAEVINFADV